MNGAWDAERLIAFALGHGFDAAALTDAAPTEAVPASAHPQAQKLESDPRRILPGAQSVLVAAMGYNPFIDEPGEAAVDAYYIASNAAHDRAKALAEALTGAGVRAAYTSELRTKPLAIRSGLGRLGRNGLVAVGDWGTRVTLQTIVTDVPAPPSDPARPGLDDMCLRCGLCVRACPAQALTGDGSLLLDRCLRAQAESAPLPEGMRGMTGGSILGCDICQKCCPRSSRVAVVRAPAPLRESLRLDRLLSGDYKALKAWLGPNNARKLRLLSRAALAAANEGRRDLMGALEKLVSEPSPLGEHAAWALEQLRAADEQID